MSSHLFETLRVGVPVLVELGWDQAQMRPFMAVFTSPHLTLLGSEIGDDDDDDDYGVLYATTLEPRPDALDLQHYRDVLRCLGIDVPAAMFEQVDADARNNVGHRVVRYLPDGTYTELDLTVAVN
jgi:hypothetical protein